MNLAQIFRAVQDLTFLSISGVFFHPPRPYTTPSENLSIFEAKIINTIPQSPSGRLILSLYQPVVVTMLFWLSYRSKFIIKSFQATINVFTVVYGVYQASRVSN